MLMRKLVYVVLLIILGGCIPPSPSLEDIHQRVAKQVEVLIDSGYLLTTYIEIDEVFSTDSNSLYYIGESDSPGSDGAELPSRVIKYTSNPQLSSSASFLRLNVLSSLN